MWTARPLVLSQFVEVVEHVHEQELRHDFFGKARLDPTVELAITQRKHAVPLVVVDQSTVVELGGSQSERVIDGWRKDQKILVAQEGRHQIAQMAIYRVRDPSQIFAPAYPARAQSAGEVSRPPLRGAIHSGWTMT